MEIRNFGEKICFQFKNIDFS